MGTAVDKGKTYMISRSGRDVPGTCLDMTKFQVRVQLDDDDDPVWIPYSAVGEEIIEEAPADAPALLSLLVNAHALIERAIMSVMTEIELRSNATTSRDQTRKER